MEFYRGRRLRNSAALRDLMAETQISANDLIMLISLLKPMTKISKAQFLPCPVNISFH